MLHQLPPERLSIRQEWRQFAAPTRKHGPSAIAVSVGGESKIHAAVSRRRGVRENHTDTWQRHGPCSRAERSLVKSTTSATQGRQGGEAQRSSRSAIDAQSRPVGPACGLVMAACLQACIDACMRGSTENKPQIRNLDTKPLVYIRGTPLTEENTVMTGTEWLSAPLIIIISSLQTSRAARISRHRPLYVCVRVTSGRAAIRRSRTSAGKDKTRFQGSIRRVCLGRCPFFCFHPWNSARLSMCVFLFPSSAVRERPIRKLN